MPTAHLPDAIEIFRPGRHIDDQGVEREFTAADVAAIAAGYNPALHEAPLTVGHPRHDLPAYGWVGALRVTPEGRLAFTARDVEPQFAEMVATRRFPKRSAAFYPPEHPKNPTPGRWYLRHVGFLGAQPPAIAGLREVQFADDAAGTVSFSEAGTGLLPAHQEHRTMTEEEKAAKARAEKAEADAKAAEDARAKAEAKAEAAEKALAQFAEQQRTARHASNVAFCEGLAKAEGEHAGRLLPKDVQIAAAALDALADAEPVEFAEGDTTRKVSPVEWLKGHLASRTPVVQFGEFAPGNAGGTHQYGKPGDDAELDRRAHAYAREHKVSYAEAVSAVVGFSAAT